MKARIYQELEDIRRQGGGVLHPEAVVRFAADPDTALHGCFEWDDAEAAHQHRLEQARGIIRVAVSVIQEGKPPVRMYVSLDDKRQRGGGYEHVADVLADPLRRDRLLRQAKREMQAFRDRYHELEELAGVMSAMDQAAA